MMGFDVQGLHDCFGAKSQAVADQAKLGAPSFPSSGILYLLFGFLLVVDSSWFGERVSFLSLDSDPFVNMNEDFLISDEL